MSFGPFERERGNKEVVRLHGFSVIDLSLGQSNGHKLGPKVTLRGKESILFYQGEGEEEDDEEKGNQCTAVF